MTELTLNATLAALGCTHRKENDEQRRTIYRADGSRVGSFTAHEAWEALQHDPCEFTRVVSRRRAVEISRYLDWKGGGVLFGKAKPFPGPTTAEDDAIRALWQTMPGSTCYRDAVLRIANGK